MAIANLASIEASLKQLDIGSSRILLVDHNGTEIIDTHLNKEPN